MSTRFRVPEKWSGNITLTASNTATTGTTVYAYLVDADRTTTYTLGSVAGGAEEATLTISCDASSVPPGESYTLEVVGDPGGANPVVLVPNSSTDDEIYFDIFQVVSITDPA